MHQALGKSVVCKQSHCDLHSVDLLEETSSQDKEVYIINVFQIYSSLRASYDKTYQGRKQYLLAISFSPDNTKCTCKPCQDKMRKGIGKRFHHFARFPYKVLRKKILFNKCTKWPISMGKSLGSKLNLWLYGKICSRQSDG